MLIWAKKHPNLMRRLWRGWCVFAHISGVLLLSGLLSYGLVMATVGEGAVWTGSDFRLLTPKVAAGEAVRFVLTATPNESCPGEFVTVFVNPSQSPESIIEQRRRVLRPGLELKDRLFSIDLTPDIAPGAWEVEYSIDSACPNRRRVDKLAHFRVVVTR